MKTTRIGIIILANELVANSWEMLGDSIFRHFIPWSIRQLPDGRLVYTGFSKMFDELNENDPYPVYLPNITQENGKPYVTTFVRSQNLHIPTPKDSNLPVDISAKRGWFRSLRRNKK